MWPQERGPVSGEEGHCSQAQQTRVTAAVDESDLNGHSSPSLPCVRVTGTRDTEHYLTQVREVEDSDGVVAVGLGKCSQNPEAVELAALDGELDVRHKEQECQAIVTLDQLGRK